MQNGIEKTVKQLYDSCYTPNVDYCKDKKKVDAAIKCVGSKGMSLGLKYGAAALDLCKCAGDAIKDFKSWKVSQVARLMASNALHSGRGVFTA